jgi:putative ABC transport system substrate-binding protein
LKKFSFVLSVILVLILALSLLSVSCAKQKVYKIGITQIATHPALDGLREGFKESLAAEGYVADKNVTYIEQNAEGDMATNSTIAQTLVSQKVDMVLGISTPSTMAVVETAKGTDIVILFGAVTDPVAAGIIENLEKPGGNITGINDMGPIDKHVDLIKEFMPDVKTIGTVYNAGEPNSVVQIDILKKKASAMGLNVVEATVSTTADVQAAAESLVGKVDTIYIVTDNTAVSAFDAIVGICEANKIPLFAADPSSVETGAIASIGPSYKGMGEDIGKIAARIFKGEKPGDIPSTGGSKFETVVNPKAAERMGITVPQAVLDRADKVVGE